ncbi:DUF2971 domain-containing protein [Wenyingzhuangia sp. 1_MG-2023]|nr:DUF2971 domain-containing protein [Wenyingzhuangia sp. 1_MG-2023]
MGKIEKMILYKYFPCNEFTYRSLAIKGLWCDTHKSMNDPFESLYIIDRKYSFEELQDFRSEIKKSSEPKWKNLIQSKNDEELTILINKLRKDSLNKFSFCSLSEEPDNILMWSHYANNHKGIVVGFDFPDLKNCHSLQKVKYSDNLPSFDIKTYAKFLIKQNSSFLNDIFQDFSIKSSHWSYEKEWRIWRDKSSYLIFKPENIKEVHFGVNTLPETKAIVVELMNYLNKDFKYNLVELTTEPLGLK